MIEIKLQLPALNNNNINIGTGILMKNQNLISSPEISKSSIISAKEVF